MKLSDFVLKRNGVPIGHSRSLRNNLERSIGAKNFSTFWNYWNPVFGYYLGIKIFKPLKKFLPVYISLIFTFIFCGLIHDVVTMLIRGKLSLFFTVWFLIMGIMVFISKKTDYNLSQKKWILRALVNLLIIIACLVITLILNNFLSFY